MYNIAVMAHGQAFFGGGTGPISLDEVECTGSEGSLALCQSNRFHNCAHSEDAGVTCLGEQATYLVGTLQVMGHIGPFVLHKYFLKCKGT